MPEVAITFVAPPAVKSTVTFLPLETIVSLPEPAVILTALFVLSTTAKSPPAPSDTFVSPDAVLLILATFPPSSLNLTSAEVESSTFLTPVDSLKSISSSTADETVIAKLPFLSSLSSKAVVSDALNVLIFVSVPTI